MNLGKLEGEFTWYLRDFLGFTNILSFLLKKPLGGVKGRREKVRLCSRLLWSKSRPTPLISVEPLWICRSAAERDPRPDSHGLPGVMFCSLEAEKMDELGFPGTWCTAWASRGCKTPQNLGLLKQRESKGPRSQVGHG